MPRNRWDLLDVPELGAWEPTLRVSVILPYYENPEELHRTLLGLGEQTYPADLIEVIVVDDGSPTRPPESPPPLPFSLKMLRQEDLGYGLARARNLGAEAAAGDVLVFLDSDMIPTRRHLEAHARWHHCAAGLVTVGFRFHAEFSGLADEKIVEAVRNDAVADLFDPSEVQRPTWIDDHMERTGDMLGPHEDLYLMMSGGNIGIDRDLYLQAGGTDESFTRWGGEDNELAFRLLQLGAVVIPERAATAWHQGEGHEPSEEEKQALRLQKPKMKSLIPDPSMRPHVPGRGYPRPFLLVHVDPARHDAEVVGLTVDSLLGGDFTDLVVGVGPARDEKENEWLVATYEGDPRVVVGVTPAALIASSPFSPARLTTLAGVGFSPDSLGRALAELGGPGVGLLHVTLPVEGDEVQLARVVMTRAENRARRLSPDDLDPTIGRLFGERWVSGSSLGIWPIEDPLVDSLRVARRVHTGEIALLAQLEDVSSRLLDLQARRSMRFIDGLGTMVRARSWDDFKVGWRAVRGAIFRDRSHRQGEPPRG